MTKRELHGWLIIVVFILTLIGVWGGAAGSLSAFIPPLVKQFGWSRARVSSLASIGAIGFALGSPVTGWVIARIGARIPVVIGAAITGLGLLASSRVNSFTPLAVLYLVAGVGVGMATTVPASVVAANWFTRNRGLAMGFAMTGASAGGMITVQVVTRVTGAAGWRAAYIALGLPIFIIVIPLVILVVRLHPPEWEQAARPGADAPQFSGHLYGLTLRESLRTRSFWLLNLMTLTWYFASTGSITQLFAYMADIGYSHTAAATVVSIAFGATAVGKSVFGLLADWIGSRAAEVVGAMGLAIGCGLLVYAHSMVALVLFLVIFGLAWGSILVLMPLVTIDSLGLKHYGSVGGTVQALTVLGGTAGPFITGYLVDVTNYPFVFHVCMASALASALLTLGCRAEYAHTAKPEAVLAAGRA